MAQQLSETATNGEEGAANFNFDQWLIKYELTDIKQVLVDHNMNTLSSLNLNNVNFVKVMSDQRVVVHTHLIPKIIAAIQSLESIRNSRDQKQKTKSKLVFVSTKENEILSQIKQYLVDIKNLNDELKNIESKYHNKKQQNLKIIQKNKDDKLNKINDEITKVFGGLHKILYQKEKELKNKIIEYKMKTNVGDNKTDELDGLLQNTCIMVNDDEKYVQEKMDSCKEVYNNDNDDFDFHTETEDRRNKIVNIGNETKEYFDERMQEINNNKQEIIKYIENDLESKDNELMVLPTLNVNSAIYNDICQDINSFVDVQSIQNVQNKMKSKSEQIELLKSQMTNNRRSLNNIIRSKQQRIDSVNNKLNNEMNRSNEYNSQLSEISKKNEKLNKRVKSLNVQISVKQQQIDCIDKKLNDERHRSNEYSSQLSEITIKNEQLNQKMVCLNNKLKQKDEQIEKKETDAPKVSSNDSSPKYACAKVMKMAMNYISPIVEPPSESDTSEHTISQVNSPITENKNENELNDEINDEIWQQEANKYFAKTENVLIQILCTQQFNLLIKARRDVLRLYDEYAEKKISENKHNREYHAVLRWQKTNIDEIVNHDIRYIEDLQYMRQRYVSQIESNNYHIDINQEFAAKQQIKTWKQQRNYLINDTKNAHLLQTLHNNNNISEMSKKEMAYRKSSIETIDQFIKTLEENDIYDEIKENNNEIYSNIYTDKKIEIVEKKMFNNEYFAKRHFEQTEKKQWQVFKQFQQHINKLGVQTVIAGFNTGKINHKIKELICEGKLFVDVGKKVDMNSFRNCTVGKKFKKEKCELNDFQFKIYLYPNIGNNCVQFTIKLQQIPIEVESVVIYMQLYEKKTGTHFHITNIFNDIGREIGWSNQLLSMKDCLNHKKLQFGYKIQILRISYNDKMKAINDYCKDGLLTSDKLNWTWQLNKNIISSFQQCVGKRKLLVFYHKNIRNTLTGGSFCVSLSSVPQTKNNNIAITLHIFKLPPKTEKLQILFEFDVKKPNIKHRKIEILDYNMNSCTIELNKKESMGLLSVGSGVKLNFKVKFIKMWFRDFMDTPYMQGLNGENNSNMNGNNNFKTTSPKKCKSVKSSKNGKNVKRVNGNHKQRKRNNKKGKTKTK
eukprot:162411_1